MGYKEGKGLGKNAQGRVNIVEASLQRGRRGLGLNLKGLEPSMDVDWKEEDDTVRSSHCLNIDPPGRVAQLVKCLTTAVCLTADPGVAISIPARSHTFVEIDHEIITTVILFPSADSFKMGCLSVTSESMCTKYWLTCLFKLAQEKKCGYVN